MTRIFYEPDIDVIAATYNTENPLAPPLNLMYNSRNYRLSPNRPTYMPLAPVSLRLGDPNSGPDKRYIQMPGKEGRDARIFAPARKDEIRRLGTYYGTYDESLPVLASRILSITATDEDGNPITFPLDDPDCLGFQTTPFSSTSGLDMQSEMEILRDRMRVLEAAMEEKIARVSDIERDNTNLDFSNLPDLSKPPKPPKANSPTLPLPVP